MAGLLMSLKGGCSMDFLEMAKRIKPVKGRRLTAYLATFLQATPDELSRWQGGWTEVNTAKVVEILRRRGLIEEHETQSGNSDWLVQLSYRVPIFEQSEQKGEEQGNP